MDSQPAWCIAVANLGRATEGENKLFVSLDGADFSAALFVV
jgi:hypothetical protein